MQTEIRLERVSWHRTVLDPFTSKATLIQPRLLTPAASPFCRKARGKIRKLRASLFQGACPKCGASRTEAGQPPGGAQGVEWERVMKPLNRRFQRPAPGAQDQTIRARCQITGTVLAKFNEPLAWPGSACKYSEACHSYGWPDRILHGSDAEGVLRRAPCPVLIAKEPNQTRISPILN